MNCVFVSCVIHTKREKKKTEKENGVQRRKREAVLG